MAVPAAAPWSEEKGKKVMKRKGKKVWRGLDLDVRDGFLSFAGSLLSSSHVFFGQGEGITVHSLVEVACFVETCPDCFV